MVNNTVRTIRDRTGAGRMMAKTSGIPALCMAAGLCAHLIILGGGSALAQNSGTGTTRTDEPPVLRLSLVDAIQAALDNNPNVKLYRERIQAARSVSRTQLGALLPNLAATG